MGIDICIGFEGKGSDISVAMRKLVERRLGEHGIDPSTISWAGREKRQGRVYPIQRLVEAVRDETRLATLFGRESLSTLAPLVPITCSVYEMILPFRFDPPISAFNGGMPSDFGLQDYSSCKRNGEIIARYIDSETGEMTEDRDAPPPRRMRPYFLTDPSLMFFHSAYRIAPAAKAFVDLFGRNTEESVGAERMWACCMAGIEHRAVVCYG